MCPRGRHGLAQSCVRNCWVRPTGEISVVGWRHRDRGSGAMVDTPRTKLQPRPIRLVHKLRIRVDGGPDTGPTWAPDDGARLAIGPADDNALVLRDAAVSR